MAIDESNPEADFEPHRRHLMAVAYRLVGSLAEAEDLVQEAYLRWHDTDRSTILNVRAFLSKVLVRLCLDHLKKARVRREQYVGEWLPEPVLDDEALTAETASELADDLSVGLMLVLERLSPLERPRFCCMTSSISISRRWPKRWEELKRRAASLQLEPAPMCKTLGRGFVFLERTGHELPRLFSSQPGREMCKP